MKLCVTGLRGLPDIMGGIETHSQHLYQRIAEIDPSIQIVVLGRTPYIGKDKYQWNGIEISPVWTVRNKYLETVLHSFVSIIVARFVERADIVHIHAIGPGLFAPMARLFGLKVILTHHGQDYNRAKWGLVARNILRFGEVIAVRAAHRVISVSKSGAVELRSRFPGQSENILHIPNGALTPKAESGESDILNELGLSPGTYILAVGRLVEEKGFQDLVAARSKAQTDLKVVIVGGADHEDSFATQLRSRASDSVIFAGMRRAAELAVLYRNTALFVLPSYHEGLPIVALEALHARAPVLLSDIPQNLDFGLPPQCYFKVGNQDALAAAISARSFEPLRIDVNDLPTDFDWDNIAVETHSVIDGLSDIVSRSRA